MNLNASCTSPPEVEITQGMESVEATRTESNKHPYEQSQVKAMASADKKHARLRKPKLRRSGTSGLKQSHTGIPTEHSNDSAED